ncbi:hypothetical protein [Halomarina rubra]|uniref:Uncharacterized protein n=1 Tax=Halomarina rubra TaxID=2071873 RepID=A0ABD6B1E4_9EURY|nr:hypothetical protein [Halomarina rubra]
MSERPSTKVEQDSERRIIHMKLLDSRAGQMVEEHREGGKRRLAITVTEKEFQVARYCGILFRHPYTEGFIYWGPWQDVETCPGITRCLVTKYTEADLRSGVEVLHDHDEFTDIEFKLGSYDDW